MAEPGEVRQQRRPPRGSDYYQRVGDLQQSLRDSERRRLELERKLFECSRSNRAISRLKYVKLTNSLKEICEWEKKAQRRNQEILEDFDRIEAHARALTPSTEELQQMKAEYEKRVERVLPIRKKSPQTTFEQKEDVGGQMLPVGKEAGINTSLSSASYHPATIFMNRQMSTNSSIEHFSTQHQSSQPTKSFSIYDPNSCRQAAKSCSVTDSCVIQTNSDIQRLNKSDKIDGKTSIQISKKASITSSISSEHEKTHSADIESVTSNRSRSVEDEQSAKLSSPLHERLTPENRKKDLKYYSPSSKVEKALAHENPVINEERFAPVQPEFLPRALDSFSEPSSDKHEARGGKDWGLDGLWPIESASNMDNESLDSSSDLTVSVSESDDSLCPTKPPMDVQHLERPTEGGRSIRTEHEEVGCSITSPHLLEAESVSDLERSQVHLSEEGFFHLLQSVEEMVQDSGLEGCILYQNTAINSAKLKEIVSLSNQRMALKEEDLEACTTVVLHQFQRLRQSTLKRALLPEETLVDSCSSTDGKPKRSDSPLNSPSLHDRLGKHALFLKDHHLLQKKNMAEIFNYLPTTENDEQTTSVGAIDHLTVSLSKKILTDESEEVSSVHSHRSSSGRLSILSDTSEAKHTKPAQKLDNDRIMEQGEMVDRTGHSTPEHRDDVHIFSDESEEEAEERTPRERKATQVPKTILQNSKSIGEEVNQIESVSGVSELEQLPGLNSGSQITKAKTNGKIGSDPSVSSSETSPLSRGENKKEVVTNLKSKAFWGESDDSTSDIENVLRPQNQNSDADDFDDFYD